jgi:ABC-type branched-subunit amino acid transport system ATPase component
MTDLRRDVIEGLEAKGIIVRFGGLVALDEVSVTAPLSRITGLIGPNGAGKTTMFNVCSGFQRPNAGTVLFDGKEVTGSTPSQRARLGLGRTFQRQELFLSLTVRENLELAVESRWVSGDPLTQLGLLHGGRSVRRIARAEAAALLDETGLGPVADRLAAEISTGNGRLLELARALARNPKILLMDEPSSGLDARESAEFGQLLVRLTSERELGILMVEHDMSLVLTICDWIQVLDFGQPLMAGTPDEVRRSEEVQEAYLGKWTAA